MGLRTGVEDLHLIVSSLPHFAIPGNGILKACPVQKEGIIGPAVGPFNVPVTNSVAGGNLRQFRIWVSDHERTVVELLSVIREHVGAEPVGNLRQAGNYYRFLCVDLIRLPGIGRNIIQIALVI